MLHSYETSGVKIAGALPDPRREGGAARPALPGGLVLDRPARGRLDHPVFHRHYDDFEATPNFCRHAS